MVQLDYYQRKLTYQLRIEQQFVTKDVDGSPTQLDIDSSKHQELESAKESIEVIKLRRATKKQTQCKRTRRAQGPAVHNSNNNTNNTNNNNASNSNSNNEGGDDNKWGQT